MLQLYYKISSQVPRQTKNIPDVKVPKPVAPGENIRFRYSPGGNSGGNGGGGENPGLSLEDWACPQIPNENQVISNAEFWRSLDPQEPDTCNLDEGDSDEDDCSIRKSVEEFPRRRLLAGAAPALTPTAKLDKLVMSQYDFTNVALSPIKDRDRDGRQLTLQNKTLKKIGYYYQIDLGLFSLGDKVPCPIQNDPNKFQRTDCWAVTDRTVAEVVERILELTTDLAPHLLTIRAPMRHCPTQDAFTYVDPRTGSAVHFHLDGEL